jgi:hypothetical protein
MFTLVRVKRHLELNKLANIMEIQGNKLLKNVKTRWMFMWELTKKLMSVYYTLVVKMAMDFASSNSTKVNFDVILKSFMG